MLLTEFMGVDPDFAQRIETRRRSEEEEQMNSDMARDFDNDRTSMDKFDVDLVKKIIAFAVKKDYNLNRQGDEMLKTWEEELHPDSYLDNDEFNKLYKQFEQLKDSTDTPLIQFNKLYSLTKELADAADEFDNWKDSDAGDDWKRNR